MSLRWVAAVFSAHSPQRMLPAPAAAPALHLESKEPQQQGSILHTAFRTF